MAQLRPAEVPLSYAQRRLWFLDRLEGDGAGRRSATYTIPLAVRLCGDLDRAALQGALSDVVARHESLRTVFPERLGVPRQEVLPAALARVELCVEAVSEAELCGALSAAAGRGFDLSRELPLRAHLFALADAASSEPEQVLGLHMDQSSLCVIQDERFKYVHFAALPPLFFDLEKDPNQFTNLADDPAYAALVRDYAQKALSWRLTHADRTLTHFRSSPRGLEEREAPET